MFPPSRASRARNGTMTASHSDPFALCAVISWIASACAGSVSRILSKLRRSVSAKSHKLVVRDSEHLSQHSHDFVARIWIGHDCEQRREPRVRRMFGLTITFRLDLHRNLLFGQRIANRP